MKSIRFIILGIAILAAGGAAYLAMNLTAPEPAKQSVEQVAPAIATVAVLVATVDVPTGNSMTAEKMKWLDWPETSVSEAFITKVGQPDALEKMTGAIARTTIYANEPIREAKLVRSDRGYMSAILPAGRRAIATAISADTSAGGFILPNDRVDVIMTRRGNKKDGKLNFITETILTNVRVLAIDQTIEDKNGEKVVVGETATLELGPDEAEILTVAQQMADRLTLALRSLEDSKEDESTNATHLLSGKNRKAKGNIRIIRFGSTEEVLPQK
jgi:pilus assembly protein CpaB